MSLLVYQFVFVLKEEKMNKKKQEKIKKSTTSCNYERPYGVQQLPIWLLFNPRVLTIRVRGTLG